MTELPTTPGSIILEGKPELCPEDGSRWMGIVLQLRDDGLWRQLTDNGKRGARMRANTFRTEETTVLYIAPPDPKPYKKLRRALEDYEHMLGRTRRMEQDLTEQARIIARLKAACE